jgi:hypothetical protein
MKDGYRSSDLNYLVLDANTENLSLEPSQSELDNFENHISNQFYTEMSYKKHPMINENKPCFGISNNINETFLAMNGNGNEGNEFSNGGEVTKPIQCLQSLSRKDTLHSSLRKTSDVSSSLSMDQLIIPEQQSFLTSSQMKFIGNKRKSHALSREEKKQVKLERNRLSAQKSRQKKKAYVTELEEKLFQMEEELNNAKKSQFQNMNTLENKLEKVFYHFIKNKKFS